MHLFAAFFDKHLTNLKNDRDTALMLVGLALPEWDAFASGAVPESGIPDGEDLIFARSWKLPAST